VNKQNELLTEFKDAESFAQNYFNYLNQVFSKINIKEIVSLINILIDARQRGAHIFFMGNGGSASTASHFANDIAIGTRSWDKPFRATSLTDNQSMVTAIANDDGYKNIFIQQLQVLMARGDVVVAISASGNSENILRAVEHANNCGGVTVGITAFDGGKLQKEVQHYVHIPTKKGEYGPAEDSHMAINHLVGAYIKHHVKSEPLNC
jgi:D-sedoheptulose 7-phosphate isomerase